MEGGGLISGECSPLQLRTHVHRHGHAVCSKASKTLLRRGLRMEEGGPNKSCTPVEQIDAILHFLLCHSQSFGLIQVRRRLPSHLGAMQAGRSAIAALQGRQKPKNLGTWSHDCICGVIFLPLSIIQRWAGCRKKSQRSRRRPRRKCAALARRQRSTSHHFFSSVVPAQSCRD